MNHSSIRKPFKRITMILLSLALLLPVLAACTSSHSGVDEEQRVLRIGYMSGDSNYDDYMRTQYTDLFEFTHTNIEIELVPAVDWSKQRYQTPTEGEPYKEPNYLESMKELIQSDNPPDLVFVDYDVLGALTQDNMLQPLESFMQEDEFSVEGIVPTVVNGIKAQGDNKLYALAPTFSTSALIYNRAIFDEQGVPYPTDKMTWGEIFNLARQLSHGEGGERVYGFGFSRYAYEDLFYGMDAYIAPLQLRILDDAAESMLVDSGAWERAWDTLIQLKQEKILPEPQEMSYMDNAPRIMNPYEGDAFMSGKLAMSIIHYSQLNEIISANDNAQNLENFTPIQWDVVTMPVHEEAPDVGGFISMDPIMGIAANAQNPEDAWEFIKFHNSDDWAKLKSRSMSMMVSREAHIKTREDLDYNIKAFYTLTPTRSVINSFNLELDPMIRQNLWQVTQLGQTKMNEVVNGDKAIRDALKEWETEGNTMLQQIRENPEAPIMMYKY